jgi:thiol-disulfide isomerase/thioredoxin
MRYGVYLLAAVMRAVQPTQTAAQALEDITVEQAVARIRVVAGGPALVVFYKTTCPLSQAMFPSLVALAREQGGAGVAFLVFSVDAEDSRQAVPGFLADHSAPFSGVWVKRWSPGTFMRAMAEVGIVVGSEWTTPLVAVRAADGRIITQAEGPTNVSGLSGVLAAMR